MSVEPNQIKHIANLLEALETRPAEPEARRRFDDAIWEACGTEAAMLVTDLSGFTRLTRKHGILHFLAVFRRCQNACLPLITRHSGELMKQEADDLLAIFARPGHALSCALDMLRAARALNTELDADDQVHLCIGVEHGPLLRLQGDAFGDTVNVAFKLGEDIADAGEVLIGPNLHAWAKETGYDFTGCHLSEAREVETGAITLRHWAVTLHA